jgi:dTMP kinase
MIVGGVFITLEGGEGSGKSTQLVRLAERLRADGFDVVVTREPGGTPVGDRIREILLDTGHAGMAPMAELLLYEASRAELVDKVIEPALARGAVVLCDRFADSSTAYQSFARGLPLDDVLALNALATAGRTPDLTLVFDVDPRIGLVRANATSTADRLESEALDFHQSVRAAFLTLADREPARFAVIDATRDEDEVAAQVSAIVRTVLAR